MSAHWNPVAQSERAMPQCLGGPIVPGEDFIPTLSVARPVLLSMGDGGRIMKKLQTGLRHSDHSGAILQKTVFYEPTDWAVTLSGAQTLEFAMRADELNPSPDDIGNLADKIIHNIGESLRDSAPLMPFVVGETMELGTRYTKKHKIGMVASGGVVAEKKKMSHSRQKRIPRGTRQLIVENGICHDVLADFLDDAGVRVIGSTPFLPHIAVGMNKKGFTPRQFTALSRAIRPAMPPVIQLGDPVLHLRTKSDNIYEPIHVRPKMFSMRHPSPSSRRTLKLA